LLRVRRPGQPGHRRGARVKAEHLAIRRDGPVAILTVTREKALNALSSAVLGALLDAAAVLEADAALRAVVVTGAGDKAFVAGADISEMQEMEMDRAE